MKNILFISVFFISIIGYSQKKLVKYYNEKGVEVSKSKFKKSINYKVNLDTYFENDTTKNYILIPRSVVGKLNPKEFIALKNHLNKISRFELDTTKFIVINYLSSIPNKSKNTKPNPYWNAFGKEYLRKIDRIDNIQQYSIYNPENNHLKYFHKKRFNWLADEHDFIKNMFFPYDVMYGNFLIIRPSGVFVYYLGEHSEYQILETTKKFLNKD
ncbi:hypothetical protein [Hwangdonia lutea]|uniref:Uncharacterized protein n=1 Tax=Hwangdonia lutea TaxID=3075823 RepID=A0AA97ERG8_9FLAO|nr:hypothetical protein [Hwangdonia sp. SCSIO 19198]WOD45155.1 hypothetical protein RNZ46_07765 [Hwangdonia sp. SCSIO 19198]